MQSAPKTALCEQPEYAKAATLLEHPAWSLDLIKEKELPEHADSGRVTTLETAAASWCEQCLWCSNNVHTNDHQTHSYQKSWYLHIPPPFPAFQPLSTTWHSKIKATREDDQYMLHSLANPVRKKSPGILHPYLSSYLWKNWQLPKMIIDFDLQKASNSYTERNQNLC